MSAMETERHQRLLLGPSAHIVLVTFDMLEVEADGISAGIGVLDEADAMRSQVDMAVLVVGQLVLPLKAQQQCQCSGPGLE